MSNYLNESTTTRSDDPEVIRRNIDATRADLSRDVDALTEKVSPGRVVSRNVDRAKGRVSAVTDRVMGSHGSHSKGAMGSVSDRASSLVGSVGDTASGAPAAAR